MKNDALKRVLKTHRDTCSFHVYSGDRHCSCGRDESIEMLNVLADEWMKSDDEKIVSCGKQLFNIIPRRGL